MAFLAYIVKKIYKLHGKINLGSPRTPRSLRFGSDSRSAEIDSGDACFSQRGWEHFVGVLVHSGQVHVLTEVWVAAVAAVS